MGEALSRRTITTVVKATVGLSLLLILFWRLDLHSILHALGSYRAQGIVAATFAFLVACLVAVLRWQLFVPQCSFMYLLRLSFIGQFYALVLPGQLAGEAVKAYRLAKGQSDAARLAGSVLIDRVIGTLALLCIANAGVLLSSRLLTPVIGWSFLVLTAIVGGALITQRIPAIYVLAMKIPDRLRQSRARWARLASGVAAFITVWPDYGRKPLRLLASFTLSLAFHGLVVAIYAILALDLAIDVALTDWLWITAFVSLAVLLPITIAGIGVRRRARWRAYLPRNPGGAGARPFYWCFRDHRLRCANRLACGNEPSSITCPARACATGIGVRIITAAISVGNARQPQHVRSSTASSAVLRTER
jgi:uncharacterized protein (TIRG00374 family)